MEVPGSSSGHVAKAVSGSSVEGFSLSGQEEEEEGGADTEQWALRGNWIAAHPTFTKMMSLDVADSGGVYAAFLVYLDLLEVRNWHEVSYTGLVELQLVCLHGREREGEDLQVVVPTPVHESFSHERVRQIMKTVCAMQEKPDTPISIILAIVESDSTIVYYKLTDGFVMPDPPDDTEDVNSKQWRKRRKKFLR
uniref:tRNA splicing endonuclease subunit 15 n=1 Tax=Salvator merianae TaxID=96440 RepID=A0A8D0C0N9_SALMN